MGKTHRNAVSRFGISIAAMLLFRVVVVVLV